MKNLISKLTLITILFYFNSCKKYDDGPRISLRSKTERLSNKWKIKKAYLSDRIIDYQDITNEWENGFIEFKDNNEFILNKYNPSKSVKIVETGTWEFINKKNQILTKGTERELEVSTGDIIDESNYDTYYTIQKLKENEVTIWFTHNPSSNNPIYEHIELIPF